MKKAGMFILIMVLFTFVGCSSKKDSILELSRLQAEDGRFQFRDLLFGGSVEETMEKTGLEFEEMTVEDSASCVYYSLEKLKFQGESAKMWLEFSDGQLETVKFDFALSNGEKQFNEIVRMLESLYGEAEVIEPEEGRLASVIYKWQKEDTCMNAMLVTSGSEMKGILGVFRVQDTHVGE